MFATNDSKYEDCFVSFIDILGFKSFTESSADSFDKIEEALIFLSEFIGSGHNYKVEDKRISIQAQVRSFSDNIVIFRPIASSSFGFFLGQVNQINSQLYSLGLPVRGAITIGKMYWNSQWFGENGIPSKNKLLDKYRKISGNNQNILFGEGLNCAYKLESEDAKVPRIIISNELYSYLDKNREDLELIKSFCLTNPNKHMNVFDFIKKDIDDFYFFDFLNKDIKYELLLNMTVNDDIIEVGKENIEYNHFLKKVSSLAEEGLKNAKKETIKDKYIWLTNYINSKRL